MMSQPILRLNTAGQPLEWVNWETAACLYSRNLVSWSLGGVVQKVHGGINRISGRRSYLELPAIIASGSACAAQQRSVPALTNTALFSRDNYQCLYCGKRFAGGELSRDHVHPTSRGGLNRWENVVAACKRCNQRKGHWLLDEINMDLLALPYRPNRSEYLALINSTRIRDDQVEYLRPLFSRLTHL